MMRVLTLYPRAASDRIATKMEGAVVEKFIVSISAIDNINACVMRVWFTRQRLQKFADLERLKREKVKSTKKGATYIEERSRESEGTQPMSKIVKVPTIIMMQMDNEENRKVLIIMLSLLRGLEENDAQGLCGVIIIFNQSDKRVLNPS